MIMIRDYKIVWALSIINEAVAYTLSEHIPDYEECAFNTITDVFIWNALGIHLGWKILVWL